MCGKRRTSSALRATLLALAFLAGVGAALSASGCMTDSGSGPAQSDAAAAAGTTTGDDAAETTTETTTSSKPISADDYDPSRFDETSTTIDNEWWPLAPGTQFTWRGWTQEDEE